MSLGLGPSVRSLPLASGDPQDLVGPLSAQRCLHPVCPAPLLSGCRLFGLGHVISPVAMWVGALIRLFGVSRMLKDTRKGAGPSSGPPSMAGTHGFNPPG